MAAALPDEAGSARAVVGAQGSKAVPSVRAARPRACREGGRLREAGGGVDIASQPAIAQLQAPLAQQHAAQRSRPCPLWPQCHQSISSATASLSHHSGPATPVSFSHRGSAAICGPHTARCKPYTLCPQWVSHHFPFSPSMYLSSAARTPLLRWAGILQSPGLWLRRQSGWSPYGAVIFDASGVLLPSPQHTAAGAYAHVSFALGSCTHTQNALHVSIGHLHAVMWWWCCPTFPVAPSEALELTAVLGSAGQGPSTAGGNTDLQDSYRTHFSPQGHHTNSKDEAHHTSSHECWSYPSEFRAVKELQAYFPVLMMPRALSWLSYFSLYRLGGPELYSSRHCPASSAVWRGK